MSWKTLSSQAMTAFMDGNLDEATRLWRESVHRIEADGEAPQVDIGQIYYFLGKCLIDSGDQIDEPIELFATAEKIIEESDPGHSYLTQIKYDLGEALNRAGRSQEATSRLRFAKGLVDEPVASCLSGPRGDDLDLKPLVKAFQKWGLLKGLDAREIKRIAAVLVEMGKADQGDLEGINPFDLFYEYYRDESRRKADSCVLTPWDEEVSLAGLIESMNECMGFPMFAPEDLMEIEGVPALVMERDENGSLCAKLESYTPEEDLIHLVNYKLASNEDECRWLRLCGYDDRMAALLLRKETAGALYRAGAAHVFENPTRDIEPPEPRLERF
ncbi:MAG: hypothetical protein KC777_22355 [Cyanobacteria bacterium HKST-UBA02]|nr:hypothetical protein [Cyanobacteria bacterium HKST-UBA02]